MVGGRDEQAIDRGARSSSNSSEFAGCSRLRRPSPNSFTGAITCSFTGTVSSAIPSAIAIPIAVTISGAITCSKSSPASRGSLLAAGIIFAGDKSLG